MITIHGIQSGHCEAFGETEGWQLSTGSGDRSHWWRILFSEPFVSTPVVHLALSGIDSSSTYNQRLVLKAHGVSRYGCDIECRTWADSQVHFLSFSWLAVGIAALAD